MISPPLYPQVGFLKHKKHPKQFCTEGVCDPLIVSKIEFYLVFGGLFGGCLPLIFQAKDAPAFLLLKDFQPVGDEAPVLFEPGQILMVKVLMRVVVMQTVQMKVDPHPGKHQAVLNLWPHLVGDPRQNPIITAEKPTSRIPASIALLGDAVDVRREMGLRELRDVGVVEKFPQRPGDVAVILLSLTPNSQRQLLFGSKSAVIDPTEKLQVSILQLNIAVSLSLDTAPLSVTHSRLTPIKAGGSASTRVSTRCFYLPVLGVYHAVQSEIKWLDLSGKP